MPEVQESVMSANEERGLLKGVISNHRESGSRSKRNLSFGAFLK